MPWEQNLYKMVGRAVGISLRNGQATSGILCGADKDMVYITEYLYRDQFATKHYAINTIQDLYPFPPCQRQNSRSHPRRRMF